MPQAKAKPKVARLKRRLDAAGITQVQVAAEAHVTPVHVCNVLAGRDQSKRVIEAAERLLAEKEQVPA